MPSRRKLQLALRLFFVRIQLNWPSDRNTQDNNIKSYHVNEFNIAHRLTLFWYVLSHPLLGGGGSVPGFLVRFAFTPRSVELQVTYFSTTETHVKAL